MTLYYVEQDDSYVGCGEPGCCGESYEGTEESFVNCTCEEVESNMADHLQYCNGGGEVLFWRKATDLEIRAWHDGKDEGFQAGADWGIEWQKKKEVK